MKLKCVSAAFFKVEEPLSRLMLGVDMSIAEYASTKRTANTTPSCPKKSRAVDKTGAHETSGGNGHRWACVCVDAEKGSGEPMLFSSVKQYYLQPSWRKSQMFNLLKGNR